MFENSLKEAYGWEYWIAACCSGEEMRSHWTTEMTNCANTEWSQRRPRAKLPYLVHWFCKWRRSYALAWEPETSQGNCSRKISVILPSFPWCSCFVLAACATYTMFFQHLNVVHQRISASLLPCLICFNTEMKAL